MQCDNVHERVGKIKERPIKIKICVDFRMFVKVL